jgi:opacity protein-like surface antigen
VRAFPLLFIVVACAASAAAAQSIPLTGIASAAGPNGRVSERAAGPNAQVTQRIGGPNAVVARAGKADGVTIHYPNCAVVGAARALPIRRGEPGYGRHLDPAGTGSACD